MLSISEINLKVKEVKYMDYEVLKKFRSELIYIRNNDKKLLLKQKEQLHILLVAIFNKMKTFKEYIIDPDFDIALRDKKREEAKNERKKVTNKQRHNYEIVYHTEEQSIEELKNKPVLYEIINTHGGDNCGKKYVCFVRNIKDLGTVLGHDKKLGNRELAKDVKEFGEKYFELHVLKVIKSELCEQEKSTLIREYQSKGIKLYNIKGID